MLSREHMLHRRRGQTLHAMRRLWDSSKERAARPPLSRPLDLRCIAVAGKFKGHHPPVVQHQQALVLPRFRPRNCAREGARGARPVRARSLGASVTCALASARHPAHKAPPALQARTLIGGAHIGDVGAGDCVWVVVVPKVGGDVLGKHIRRQPLHGLARRVHVGRQLRDIPATKAPAIGPGARPPPAAAARTHPRERGCPTDASSLHATIVLTTSACANTASKGPSLVRAAPMAARMASWSRR